MRYNDSGLRFIAMLSPGPDPFVDCTLQSSRSVSIGAAAGCIEVARFKAFRPIKNGHHNDGRAIGQSRLN